MSSGEAPDSCMYEIVSLIERTNSLAVSLTRTGHGVCRTSTLLMPRFRPSELGFLRAVSWFYVLYFETGRPSIKFLSERFRTYGHDRQGDMAGHPELIDQMRTYMQHDLHIEVERNLARKRACENWFRQKCGTAVPEGEEQWYNCLMHFLDVNRLFLRLIYDCLRSIEQDEARDQVLDDWDFRVRRYHEPHQFDAIVEEVATDLGRLNLDVVNFRKRHYQRWNKELQLLNGDYDFRREATRLIELTLISETSDRLPLTAKDVMNELHVPPGPRVGACLRRALAFYESEKCDRGELLSRLQSLLVINAI